MRKQSPICFNWAKDIPWHYYFSVWNEALKRYFNSWMKDSEACSFGKKPVWVLVRSNWSTKPITKRVFIGKSRKDINISFEITQSYFWYQTPFPYLWIYLSNYFHGNVSWNWQWYLFRVQFVVDLYYCIYKCLIHLIYLISTWRCSSWFTMNKEQNKITIINIKAETDYNLQ